MDLWILSQDKEKLVKCNDIVIRKFIDDDTLYSYQILGYFEKETEFEILGAYESKKRALEVLSEIKNVIYMSKLFNANVDAFKLSLEELNMSENEMNDLLKKISVYEMPEK